MLRPKYPAAPAPSAVVPTAVHRRHEPVPVTPPAPAPRRDVQLTTGGLATAIGGGAAVALVVGTVLVSLLLAVAVTAASVAVCAVVLRSLLNSQHKRY